MDAAELRAARAALIADHAQRGRAFGAVLADLLDEALRGWFVPPASPRTALVALGSYARRELCPGSDVDVLLLHDARRPDAVRAIAEACWYPLWDAGFATGHGSRTVKESLALADTDLEVLTSLLQVRHLGGDEQLTAELATRARELAVRRSGRVLGELARAADARRHRPGPVSEMLEPDLKDGAGGLRDIQALGWAGDALGGDGLDAMVTRDYVAAHDRVRLDAARAHLLDVRVALHRVTGGRHDRLALQEQDAVAGLLDAGDADRLARDLASFGREVAWVSRDVWQRVRDHLAGPGGRVARRARVLAEDVVLRDHRVVVSSAAPVPAARVLEAAAAAAEIDAPFDRSTLGKLRSMQPPTWDVWERAAFLRLLRAGAGAIAVFEALDHVGVLVRLLPEWAHVRSLPQRNAYHRFTVDRHLLEGIAQCAALLDAGDDHAGGFDALVARACRRPELLLLGALLHDIAKGMPGDHSEVGSAVAEAFVRRIGLDSEGREIVVWLVRHHLLLADVATRRDLTDAAVADNVAALASGDAERLRLLYLLTIGDSRATGPAAWNTTKAALLRDLFVKTAAAIERGQAEKLAEERREHLGARLGAERTDAHLTRLPDSYALAFEVDDMVEHVAMLEGGPAVRCDVLDDRVIVTVVAPDRPRLLATLAGALAAAGLDVTEALLFVTNDGVALDVFRATDPFGRFVAGGDRLEVAVDDALAGRVDVEARVEARRRDYRSLRSQPGAVEVRVVPGGTEDERLVEVHADDDVGLLHRVASVLADLDLDVRLAKVATLGDRVVDTFFVRRHDDDDFDDARTVQRVRAAVAQ